MCVCVCKVMFICICVCVHVFDQSTCEEKEKKLTKEMTKGPKDVAFTQEKLREATDSVQLALAEGCTVAVSWSIGNALTFLLYILFQ